MYLQYTQYTDEIYTKYQRNINDKHQAYYDYHGELDNNEDSADCYDTVKAVRIA